jgi:hypothetical protein
LWANVHYGRDEKLLLFVGHSHYFRYMMRHYIAEEYRKSHPEWTDALTKQIMNNCACMRIEIEWRVPADKSDLMEPPVITKADFMFGTTLKKGRKGSVASPDEVPHPDDTPPEELERAPSLRSIGSSPLLVGPPERQSSLFDKSDVPPSTSAEEASEEKEEVAGLVQSAMENTELAQQVEAAKGEGVAAEEETGRASEL